MTGGVKNTEKNFWQRVKKGNNNECWEWKGSFGGSLGYGVYFENYKQWGAHRYSAMLAGYDIEGKVVCHKCDNPKCVNPNHLFVGTQTDNIKDKVNKKRCAVGERNGDSRLTEQQVREIRALYKPRVYSANKLAKEYNVSNITIYNIVKRKHWKHI